MIEKLVFGFGLIGFFLHAQIPINEVESLIHTLQQNLLNAQQIDGQWIFKDQVFYFEGMTSLATLALVHSGIPSDSPQIQKAIRSILNSKNEYTYCLGLKITLLAQLDAKNYFEEIQQLTKILIRNQSGDGGFSYYSAGVSDSSNTQFAALGLYSAARSGVKIPPAIWQKMISFLLSVRSSETGGFGYKSALPLPSMTAACMSALHMAQAMTYKENHCGEWTGQPLEESGLRWLAQYFQGQAEIPKNSKAQIDYYELYFLYALERMAHLMGVREIEGWDWFYQGIQIILQRDREKKLESLVDQAFALLFLSKGRTPILMGKIVLPNLPETDPHDIENLVFEISKNLHQSFTYQRVTLKGNLSDIPMLFLSGHQSFQLSATEKETLQRYLEQGGLLIGEACCNRKEFASSFKNLVVDLLQGKGALEPLSSDHAIYQIHGQTLPSNYQTVFAAGFRCKTSILFCAKDFSCALQNTQTDSVEFQLAVNIVRFALSEGRVYDRLLAPTPESTELTADSQSGTLLIAKLAYDGDWNNDADDLRGLLQAFRETTNQSGRFAILQKNEPLPPVPILYLNGHQSIGFSSRRKEELKQFIESGGILFGEACCDKIEFAESFQSLMRELFPQVPLQLVPHNHFLYAKASEGGASPENPPPLYSMRLGCQELVFFSPKDLSCHWDPRCAWNKNGLQEWALLIGINLLQNQVRTIQTDSASIEPPEIEPEGALHFAQLIHSGDFNPDPTMLEKLIQHFYKELGIQIYSHPALVRLQQKTLFQYPFLYLTGHQLGAFTEGEIIDLRSYLERGGVLVAESCCGSVPFTQQFFNLMKQVFPTKALIQLDKTHPLLQGISLKTRPEILLELPWILEDQKRLMVFFSPLNLGCGIQGHPCPQCRGYQPETAFQIYRSVFTYLMTH
ncbi:MAG: DUF4159 domain-containing protein [Planctomycetota bacterium]